jgi:hypothetical protein
VLHRRLLDRLDVPTIAAALKEQQRTDLERSLEWAKKKLGVGVRWKS